MSRQYFAGLLVLVVEAIGVDRDLRDQPGDDVLAEVVRRVRLSRALLERRHQHRHVEDVDAHRREDLLARRQVLRLLEEAGDAILVVDLQHAEAARFFRRDLDHRQRRAGAALLVEAQHLRVVHLVDVIARQHDQLLRVLAKDRIEVLVDGVGGALVPLLADPLLRTQDLDELAELVGDDAPAHAEMAAERERLVLERDEDAPQPGVDAVAQREIDDPVRAAEIDRRLGALLRQRIEAFPDAAGQDHYENLVEHGAPFRFRTTRGCAASWPANRSGRQNRSVVPAFGD